MSAVRRQRRATAPKRDGATAKRTKKRNKKKSRPAKRASKTTVRKAKGGHKAAALRKKTVLPSKTELRRKLRAMRAQLSPNAQRRAAERLVVNLLGTRLFRASRRIACYMPDDGEIDPTEAIERIWRMGKTAYLPVLSRLPQDRLWFAPSKPGMELVPNRFGILEPRANARELVRAEQLDLILLPAVAFDERGNRLGRGAGFYDRSLAFLRYRRFLRKPHLLGLAHDFQRVRALPADPWDVPLDGVITDRAVYDIKR